MQEMDLRDVRVFVRVAELGSFAAAARSLHIAKSSVSRAITRLESHLGTQLLQRTPRALLLTDAGQRYYDRVAQALTTIMDASHEATSQDALRGIVRICAPPAVGAEALPQMVARFVALYPEVTIEVDLSSSPTSLIEGGFDLAIRGGPQPDSALMMCKLLDSSFRLFASPHYLEQAGVPQHPHDLGKHTCVLFRGKRGTDTWTLLGPDGVFDIHVTGQLSSNGLAFIRRAAIAGVGIALLPEVPGFIAVRNGWLAPVLPDYSTELNPLFIVYPASRHLPPRVRLLRQFLIASFNDMKREMDDMGLYLIA